MTTENQASCDRCVLSSDCLYTHLCDGECPTGNFYDIDNTEEQPVLSISNTDITEENYF